MERISFRDHHLIVFLKQWLGSRAPLDQSWGDYLRSHKSIGANDRRTMGNTLFGMVRWKSLLDLFCPSDDPMERLSTYRGLSIERCQQDTSLPEDVRLGLPPFLYERFKTIFGAEKTAELGQILNTEAPVTIRANLLKTTREELFAPFSEWNPQACTHSSVGIQVSGRPPLFTLPAFRDGLFEVQDEGSQIIADWVDPRPGQQVLDFCSGSGGKTLAFAHKMKGRGQIFLHDIRPSILLEAKRRLKRAGIQNAQCAEKLADKLKGTFDWVLADVPCSGSGTLRRNPDAKWGIDEAMVSRLIAEQRSIVSEVVQYLRPKGHLVYATCSVLPEENQSQVDFFLKTHPLELVKEPLTLLPQQGGMDGFFVALFRKRGA